MKLGPLCWGKCCFCACGDCCLAGNGDDEFVPAKKDQVIKRLDQGKYPDYTGQMIRFLEDAYGYVYSGTPGSKKPKWKEEIEKEILAGTDTHASGDAIIKLNRFESIETFLEHGFKSEDIIEMYGYNAEEVAEVQRHLQKND